MKKTHDGTGAPLDPAALYFIQDTRQVVGNCALWWCPNGAGYTCNLGDAGLYTGAQIIAERERETDVPWPAEYVRANAVTHVRADTRVLQRRDDVVELTAAVCGITVADADRPMFTCGMTKYHQGDCRPAAKAKRKR